LQFPQFLTNGRIVPAGEVGSNGMPLSPISMVTRILMSFLHNTLSEVNFPAPGGCTQLGQAGAVLSSTTRMI
jgi:hypothetical protein